MKNKGKAGFRRNDDDDDIGQEEAVVPVPKEKLRKYSGKSKAIIQKRFDEDYDAIYKAYTDPRKRDRLSQTQLRQLARWKFAYTWVSQFEPATDLETINALRFQFAISYEQARTDLQNMKRLFVNVDKTNEDYEKAMHIERIKRLRQKAMLLGDAKGYAVAAKCDSNLAKVKGYDKDKESLPEPKIVNVIVTGDLNSLGLPPVEDIDQKLKLLRQKKEDRERQEIADIDYEEILNNPRNERS
jgi:hypothetical protein